jgi:hypothetical protein
MANVIETLAMTPEEEMEVFESINMLLTLYVDPTLDLNAYLRSVVCETLGVPESTPDEELKSTVHDILPVYVARVRKDYGDQVDIDAFVQFIVDDMRAGN